MGPRREPLHPVAKGVLPDERVELRFQRALLRGGFVAESQERRLCCGDAGSDAASANGRRNRQVEVVFMAGL
jgi:hypothetical protein